MGPWLKREKSSQFVNKRVTQETRNKETGKFGEISTEKPNDQRRAVFLE
jgi:hypothetical protein